MKLKIKFRVLYLDESSKEFKVAEFGNHKAADTWCAGHSLNFPAFVIEYACVVDSEDVKNFYSKETAQLYAQKQGGEILPIISMELPPPALKIISSEAV